MDFDLPITVGLIVLALFILGGMIGYYNLRRQWFDERYQERLARQQQYRELIFALSEANQKMDEDTHHKLIATLDSSILVASPHIVLQLIDFQKFLRAANLKVLRNSHYWLDEREQMTMNLMRNLRHDLFGDESIVDESLADWKPLTRPAHKNEEPQFEVLTFPPTTSKPSDSQSQQH